MTINNQLNSNKILLFIILFLLCTALTFNQVQSAASVWTSETNLPVAIQEVAVTALNGQVYVTGGDTDLGRSQALYRFDPSTRVWTTLAPYPGTALDHIGIAATVSNLYILGGVTAYPAPSVTTVQRYDPAANTWTSVAPLPLARAAMAVAVINGKIYAAGGLRAGVAVNDFTVYDPTTNAWQTLPVMPTVRDHLIGATLNGKFYAIGGRNGDACAPLTTVEVYDPATNAWSTAAAMSTARGGHAAGTLNGRIQVFGGEGSTSGCGIIASAEEYDPATNTWSALPSMPTPRHGTGGATINNSIYIPGGATATGHAPTAIHERFDQSASPAPQPPSSLAATASSSSQINLSWMANSATEDGYKIEQSTDNVNFTQIASVERSVTTYSATNLSSSTTYYYRVRAYNTTGNSSYSNVATATTSAQSVSGLPTPWVSADIGSVGVAGSATHSSGTFTVKGSGADIWDTADGFHYVYQSLAGDGQIVGRVATMQNTHSNAKAGVMIREQLTAGSRHAIMNVTPGAGMEFLRRLSPGGITSWSGASGGAPSWVKLVRQGNTFSGYVSSNGINWTLVGSDTISMASSVYVGMVVSSHNDSVLCTATFDNVSVGAAPTPTLTPIPPDFLRDDFTDNSRNIYKWYRGVLADYSYTEVHADAHYSADMLVKALEQNQRLEITPRTNASAARYNGYVSVSRYNFTNKNASVEVVQAPNSASFADLNFAIGVDNNNFYRFVIENGWLRFDDATGGVRNYNNKIAYNATLHKFLRIRHDQAANTIIWETSSDRTNWTIQRTLALGFSITALRVELSGGTYQKESQPGMVIFDNFRLEPNVAAGMNKPPIADAGGRYTVTTAQTVQFNGSNSYDPDGTVSTYEWNFGDGTTGTGVSPTHTYSTPGTYVAILKVTDSNGATHSASTTATQNDTAAVGQWSKPIDFPVVSVHLHMLPNGKILTWQHESTSVPYVWDPVANNGIFTPVPIHSNQDGTRRDSLYCSGHSFLPDGRLFVPGGHIEPKGDDVYGSNLTNIFDYTQNKWSSGPNMNAGRWYPTSTTLGDGTVLITSGAIDDVGQNITPEGYNYRVNELPQVYAPNTGQMQSLTSALSKLPLYPFMFLTKSGRVFNAGPNQTTSLLDTTGTGSWTVVGNSNYGIRVTGASVMYDDDKVLIVGGAEADGQPTATTEVIDLNQSAPAWRYVGSMANARARVNAVILPDGKVLATGGHSSPGFSTVEGAVRAAEMWDPVTETWSTMSEMAFPRLHHNTAVLLPDGRVLVGGGGQPTGSDDWDKYDAEIYSPPYLFKGARPTISTAPTTVSYGQTFAVDTPDAASITQATWIRLPSNSHFFDQNQRINRLSFTKTATGLNITAPANGNSAPPGHYMLFVLNDKGVPSIAKIVQIVAAAPITSPTAPANLAAVAASSSQINLSWTDNASNEDGFKIERCQGAGCTNFTEFATVGANATAYSNTGLVGSTTYVYRVRAFNNGGNSSYSNTAQAATQSALLPPTGPSNLGATVASASQINLQWTDNSTNEQGFKIERCQGTGCTNFAEFATVGANATVYSNTGLGANTSYGYRVRAYNGVGDSAYSNVIRVKTKNR